MIHYRKILEMHSEEKTSIRSIAASTGNSRQKITEVIKLAVEKGLECPLDEVMSDKWIEEFLYPEKMVDSKGRKLPDFDYIHKEMAKPNITLSLLHHEYVTECRANHKLPYAYRTFCQYYTEYARKYKATMRIKRKPGEILEVDWAGSTAFIIDSDTGEKVKAYVFVATLPCSQLSYAEAFLSMDSEAWIEAHVHAFDYIGGITNILVPDNLKTGVTKNTKYDVILNQTYQELSEHYQTIVIPARVRTPKDKASVEGTVGVISTWIIAALRHSHCFTINELNEEIRKKLNEFNERPFTRKQGCRLTAFREEEQFALTPLPSSPYKMSTWKTAKVQLDYHVSIESMFYSVPYEYIQHNVDIRLTKGLIEIFFNHLRIASHKRLYGKFGQLATIRDHMPDNHKLYIDQTPENAVDWAKSIGDSTERIVRFILDSYQAEKQALKSILSLKNTTKKYTNQELETACTTALSYTMTPTVKSVQTILKQNKINEAKRLENTVKQSSTNHSFTRGAAYYGGK